MRQSDELLDYMRRQAKLLLEIEEAKAKEHQEEMKQLALDIAAELFRLQDSTCPGTVGGPAACTCPRT